MTKLQILVVSPKAETIRDWIKAMANEYFSATIYIAMDAMNGLLKAQRYMPIYIIVDNNLPDMNGMSFASVVKDTVEGQESSILVFGIRNILANPKADYFLPPMDDRQLESFLKLQLETFLKSRFFITAHRNEYESRKREQLNKLPKQIDNEILKVTNIFSPYDELSGDGFDYWMSSKFKDGEEILYGFLYDCTGHGPESYPLVENIRGLLKRNMRLYEYLRFKSLADVMEKANKSIMDTTPADVLTPAAAVAFSLDLKHKRLRYCTADIPSFYIRYAGEQEYAKKDCRSYPLGMFDDASYDEEEMSLDDVEELVFSSDGFSEMLYHQNDVSKEAKHDDVSAVTIQLKRPIEADDRRNAI